MKKWYLFTIFAALLGIYKASATDFTVNIDLSSKGATVSPSMYGVFFEEINHAGDGGLYAEMLMNRSFEERTLPKGGYTVANGELIAPDVINHMRGKPTPGRFRWGNDPHPGWSLTGNAAMSLTTARPANEEAPTNMVVMLRSGDVSLINSGYWGIAIEKKNKYKLRVIARASAGYTGGLKARIVLPDGNVAAEKELALPADGQWHDLHETLTASATNNGAKLYLDMKGAGEMSFDYVSLFPEKTFKGRENGLRADVAQFLADMRPAFIRWPGGCIVEGISLSNRVEWKKTLGDPALRSGEYDTWGYRNTYGFGYKEFLDYCEDIGAGGMYVCNVGIGCQGRSGDACTEEEVGFYIQDCLDAIEYALGDVTTVWGKVRAKEGHPAPYPLHYVEIGNENSGPVYDRRFDRFYKAIKAKYPELILISNHGLGNGVKGVEKTDMIDPHWYVTPDFFFDNATLFDNQPREGYTVYVGEYAVNKGVGAGNMLAALSEAAFISGMERNSDLVTMASYAPLLENRNDRGWPTNLIWLDNDQVLGRSSYWVQKMFAENTPTYNLSTVVNLPPEPKLPLSQEGYIGFGTWNTQSEYKDLKITKADGSEVTARFTDPTQWRQISGNWSLKEGAYAQSGDGNLTAMLWNKEKMGAGIIELKARKTGGNEGFFIYFGLEKPGMEKGFSINIGGWGNTQTGFEKISNGATTTKSKSVPQHIETGKWYDIKLVVSEFMVEYYLDGKRISTYELEPPVKRNFAIAGYEESSGEVIVKLVNGEETVRTAKINLNGGSLKPVGRAITLSAASPTDENSFEEPHKIIPVESKVRVTSPSFDYDLKPNSFTILRFKKR